jgi:predicted metal-dependent hydrolase
VIGFGWDTWQTSEDYLHAIDLFNEGYWWEAHETLEALWRIAGRGTPLGEFLQGLIQAAAALLKAAIGARAAAGSLARSGCRKLRGSASIVLGVDGQALASSVEAYVAGRTDALPRIDLRLEAR